MPTFGLTLVKETKDAKIPVFSFNSRTFDTFATSSSSTNVKITPSSYLTSNTSTATTTTIVTSSGNTVTTTGQEKNSKQKHTLGEYFSFIFIFKMVKYNFYRFHIIGKVKFSQKDGQYLFSEGKQSHAAVSQQRLAAASHNFTNVYFYILCYATTQCCCVVMQWLNVARYSIVFLNVIFYFLKNILNEIIY